MCKDKKDPSVTTTQSQAGSASSIGPYSIQVDDKLYSAKILADIHPGGDLFVKSFAGLNATEAFLSYHRRVFPHHLVKDALEGNVKKTATTVVNDNKDYLELCDIIDKVLPRQKSFGTWGYFFKALSLLFITFALEVFN